MQKGTRDHVIEAGTEVRHMANMQPHGAKGGFRESVRKPRMLKGTPKTTTNSCLEKREMNELTRAKHTYQIMCCDKWAY